MAKISKEQKELYIKYLRENPVIAAEELLGVYLAPHERIILKNFFNHKWNLNVSGRGVGKCAVGYDKVWDLESGRFRRIDELYEEKKHFITYSFNPEYKSVVLEEAFIEKDLVKSCYKIITENGNNVSVSYDHPLLVKGKGWVQAQNIQVGNKVAVVNRLPFGKCKISPNVAFGIGQLAGIRKFTCKSFKNLADELYYSRFFMEACKEVKSEGFPHLIWNCDEETVRHFIKGAYQERGFFRKGKFIFYSFSSEFIFNMKNLLIKFSIKSKARKARISKRKELYILCIEDRKSKNKFRKLLKDKKIKFAGNEIDYERVTKIVLLGHQQTYAIEVKNTHTYLQNQLIVHNTFMNAVYGLLRATLYPNEKIVLIAPSFRQSIFMFEEIERIIDNSSILRGSLAKDPKHLSSEYSIYLKNSSSIFAMPLGADGSKIRGKRATVLIVDEAAYLPSDIIDRAVIPFMATHKNPMAEYLGIKDENKTKNSLVLSSSAYYQFNHLYQRYKYWLQQIKAGNPEYSLSKFTYEDTPPGFIDMEVIRQQREIVPAEVFAMEYLAHFPKDSSGFYPASLVESCKDRYASILVKGDPKKEYVMGIDPARTSDKFAICIIELDNGLRRVCRIEAYKSKSFIEMRNRICELLDAFNVVRICMDKGGGGLAMADLLKESITFISPTTGKIIKSFPIYERGEIGEEYGGKNILELITFSPSVVTEMHYDLKSKMEVGVIKIPDVPGEKETEFEEIEKIFENTQKLCKEIVSINVEETKSGSLHFGVERSQEDDRFVSFLLANWAATRYETREQIKELPVGFVGRTPCPVV